MGTTTDELVQAVARALADIICVDRSLDPVRMSEAKLDSMTAVTVLRRLLADLRHSVEE